MYAKLISAEINELATSQDKCTGLGTTPTGHCVETGRSPTGGGICYSLGDLPATGICQIGIF